MQTSALSERGSQRVLVNLVPLRLQRSESVPVLDTENSTVLRPVKTMNRPSQASI